MTGSAFVPGRLLVPAPNVDPTAWACVACDQYTSEPAYWERVSQIARGKPSAYHLVLPECDLRYADERVPSIHQAMRDTLAGGVLCPGVENGFILTVRTTQSGARVGLVGLIDLEAYDYRRGYRGPVRATEETIESRLPARMAIRRGAALELSHVLMLVDDPARTVVEPLYAGRSRLNRLYDFDLMQGGGHLTGYAVTDAADLRRVRDALAKLRSPFPFAVGDGNHSLASAKACWEALRADLPPDEAAAHPARFAMVELENIHDPALRFEPIHRLVVGCNPAALLRDWAAYAAQRGMELDREGEGQAMTCLFAGREVPLRVRGARHALPVGTLQGFLDDWLAAHTEAAIDYIHGEDALRNLSARPSSVGFLLPPPDLGALFTAVDQNGALPRKTFSMGHAWEKRYYFECREIE